MSRKPNSTTVQHIFNGGFATDFGKIVNSVIPVGGQVVVPFLLEAKNCVLNLDGSPRKAGGTQKINSSALASGSPVVGLFDFWSQAVGQHRIAYAGTSIYSDNGGNFIEIFSGVTKNAVPCFTQFDDFVFITNDKNDYVRSWDGTTATSHTTLPLFSVTAVHKNRLWGTVGSTLYGSVADEPTNFTGSGSVQIDVASGDGDHITAIISHKDNLWIFKGPNKGSIYRLTGSSPDSEIEPFALREFVREGLGSINQNSIARFRDDICFQWADGSIHSLSATAAFGDYYETSLSRSFNTVLFERVSSGTLKQGWAASHRSSGRVWFTMPVDGSVTNNIIYILDSRFDPPRWTWIDAYTASCLAIVRDQSSRGLPIVMAGGSDGYIRRTQVATKSVDGSAAISCKVKTPFFNYGMPIKMKQLAHIGANIDPTGSAAVTVGWRRDGNASQSASIIQAGGDTLGPGSSSPFTLDLSILGGSSYADRWTDALDGGEFRAIQYEFTQAVAGEDLDLRYFCSTFEVNSESLENL